MTALYERLERWRRRQADRITSTLSGKERRLALVELLDKVETKQTAGRTVELYWLRLRRIYM